MAPLALNSNQVTYNYTNNWLYNGQLTQTTNYGLDDMTQNIESLYNVQENGSLNNGYKVKQVGFYRYNYSDDENYMSIYYIIITKLTYDTSLDGQWSYKITNNVDTASLTNLVDNITNITTATYTCNLYAKSQQSDANYAKFESLVNTTTVNWNNSQDAYSVGNNPTNIETKGFGSIEAAFSHAQNGYTVTAQDFDSNAGEVYIKNALRLEFEIDGIYETQYRFFAPSQTLTTMYWTVPDTPNAEIVDIPGLLFTILGMPFAFIAQSFDLTVFPGTPYSVNLSHIFLAIVCAGILIFIIKKVFK